MNRLYEIRNVENVFMVTDSSNLCHETNSVSVRCCFMMDCEGISSPKVCSKIMHPLPPFEPLEKSLAITPLPAVLIISEYELCFRYLLNLRSLPLLVLIIFFFAVVFI